VWQAAALLAAQATTPAVVWSWDLPASEHAPMLPTSWESAEEVANNGAVTDSGGKKVKKSLKSKKVKEEQ
jgi:hypothetical protein